MNLMLAVVVAGSAVGCSTMMSSEPPVPPVEGHTHGPTYKVILGDSDAKKPKIYTGAINGNMTVQQALRDSGADQKFKAMRVDLARRTESGRVLKLPVHVDASGEVMSEQNYALHTGDEILVRRAPNPSTRAFLYLSRQRRAATFARLVLRHASVQCLRGWCLRYQDELP